MAVDVAGTLRQDMTRKSRCYLASQAVAPRRRVLLRKWRRQNRVWQQGLQRGGGFSDRALLL